MHRRNSGSLKQCVLAAPVHVRWKLKEMLFRAGFSVSEADTGLAVLCQCTKRVPELILLDFHVPVMSGIEVTRTLRRFFPLIRPRIILIAENVDLDSIISAITAGADDYMLAPFDQDILAGKFAALGLD